MVTVASQKHNTNPHPHGWGLFFPTPPIRNCTGRRWRLIAFAIAGTKSSISFYKKKRILQKEGVNYVRKNFIRSAWIICSGRLSNRLLLLRRQRSMLASRRKHRRATTVPPVHIEQHQTVLFLFLPRYLTACYALAPFRFISRRSAQGLFYGL